MLDDVATPDPDARDGPNGPDRRERLLNVLALLLDSARGATLEEVVQRRELGYPASAEAARRAFERDKATLRAMGVPLQQIGTGPYRYRVDPREYYLSDLGLTDDELAALRLAVGAVALGAAPAHGALMKLGGGDGMGTDTVARLPFEPALGPLFEACRDRAVVTFRYHGQDRDVEPHDLVCRSGRWYLAGFDRLRDREAIFRVDRIDDEPTVGAPGAFAAPMPDAPRAADRLALAPWQFGPAEAETVVVRVDRARAPAVAETFGADAEVSTDGPDGDLRVTLAVRDRAGFRDALFGLDEHAEVLAPADLRAEIIAWLDAVVAADT